MSVLSNITFSPATYNFNPNVYSYNEAYDGTGTPPNTNYATWNDATYELYNAWESVATTNTTSYFGQAVGYISYSEGDLSTEFQGGNGKLNNSASYTPARRAVRLSFRPESKTDHGWRDSLHRPGGGNQRNRVQLFRLLSHFENRPQTAHDRVRGRRIRRLQSDSAVGLAPRADQDILVLPP